MGVYREIAYYSYRCLNFQGINPVSLIHCGKVIIIFAAGVIRTVDSPGGLVWLFRGFTHSMDFSVRFVRGKITTPRYRSSAQ